MKKETKEVTQHIEKRANGTLRVATINNEPSMTQQQFAKECDVNEIMRKYETTGQLTHIARNPGVYADFTNIEDYHSSLNKIIAAEDSFKSLSAEIRDRFQNDPAQLLGFLMDPKNHDEGVKLGLIEQKTNPQNPQTYPQKTNEPNEPKTQKQNQNQPTENQLELPKK